MLVKRGGAGALSQEGYEKGRFLYGYKPLSSYLTPNSWKIIIYYDDDQKLQAINFGRLLRDENFKPTKEGGEK